MSRACFLHIYMACASVYFLGCNISISRRADVYAYDINVNSLSQFREERIKPLPARVYDRVAGRLTFTSHRWLRQREIHWATGEFYVPPLWCVSSRGRRTFARPCIGKGGAGWCVSSSRVLRPRLQQKLFKTQMHCIVGIFYIDIYIFFFKYIHTHV